MSQHVIILPRVAETVDESYVAEFLVAEGDQVAVDQPILKVETDKAVVEIVSTHAGTLTSWLVAIDDEVSTGAEIATIDDGTA
ncbi:MAG TPA: biotin/lipoyl-containing protein [Protaetiibacter sp.]|jgi:2-oxoglutarate dehydrogenase E2 component (dihydrolipoamide succinyltransferase)|nr:biotin/lipoyl-containing protein [Protaetiibacter sp.]